MSEDFPSPTDRIGGAVRQSDGGWLARVRGGELRCRMTREEIPLDRACAFAARNNARRRFLFVSRLLGRHLPTPPVKLVEAARRLAEKIHAARLPGPWLFVGMAETATTLGQAVFREWRQIGAGMEQALYVDSTRRRTGEEIAFGFSEVHSHAAGHVIHRPTVQADPQDVFGNARSLVIVDDETTTAHTAARLREAYDGWRRARGRGGVARTALAVLLRWHPPSVAEEADGRDALECLSLLEGRFEFVANDDVLPAAPSQTVALDEQVVARISARGGLVRAEDLPAEWMECEEADLSGQRVLVVGTGEYGFPALRLAEELAARGAETFVQATTRSPVLPGGAIGHARQFPALSGEAHAEFLYNMPVEHSYSRVILLCEDQLPPTGHPVLDIPRIECKLAPR